MGQRFLAQWQWDVVTRFLKCRTVWIFILAGKQRVDGIQLSPLLPGISDQDADYVVIRQTTRCHVDPFGLQGVWSAEDLESFIAAWQFP
eukprot:COSAG01_NODE_59675_length_299_cov_0.545000_1_plen_88_part_10